MITKDRLRFFLTTPPLWIIQIGEDELLFSRLKKNKITIQEKLYLENKTLSLNKICNPSSLQNGLKLFLKEKKLTSIRAIFILPQKFYPLPLLPHELLQFLLSIKKTPLIVEGVKTYPLEQPTQLNQSLLLAINKSHNYLDTFNYYNKIHPGWWLLSLGLIMTSSIALVGYWPKKLPPEAATKQLPQRRSAPSKIQNPTQTLSLKHTSNILKLISSIIPPTVVLDKITTKQKNLGTSAKSQGMVISGVTCQLPNLLNFITQLERKTGKNCNLSSIKELSLDKNKQPEIKEKYALYRFSATIE